MATHRADAKTPQVKFLDCSVYQIYDINLGNLSVLVEEKLDHEKWQKWNTNNGYVEGMKAVPDISQERIREAVLQLSNVRMDVIDEGSEHDDSSETDVEGEAKVQTFKSFVFSPHEVAQAFSHFTYRASGRKRLVCDLQGVFDDKESVLLFSDPEIHYYDQHRRDRRQVHGRTDRGGKGIAMFFETHREGHCGHLCKLMLRGFHKLEPGSRRPQASGSKR